MNTNKSFSYKKEKTNTMRLSEVKADLVTNLGSILSTCETSTYHKSVSFGKFACAIEAFDQFTIVKRNFETAGEKVFIPFTSTDPTVQMIFSLDGRSFFNRQSNPFMLSSSSHCLNFFNRYDCTNLLDEKARQHDITFRLKRNFYADLIAQHLASAEETLPAMIANAKEFNTINQHLPTDAAVSGILDNILQCPFQGEMKEIYLREHIRALFTLQLFHFNHIVSGNPSQVENTITPGDRDKIHSVKDYIDQNFLSPSTLTTLARDFGLNEYKLKYTFRTVFDSSPIRYLQQKRLAHAVSLLRDTDMSIKEIALEIGYAHPANFTAAFARTFGKSPQHYRGKRMSVA